MNVDFIQRDGDGLLVVVDLGIYSVAAVQKTAYLFTGRCYVHLQYRSERIVEVRIRSKEGFVGDLDMLAREFCNELLDHTLRAVIAKETEAERNLILAHALSRHPILDRFFEGTPPFSDPEGISVPDKLR